MGDGPSCYIYNDPPLPLFLAAASSSMNSIPVELLCRIFRECQKADPHAPLGLSHICKLWREVAINYSVLWIHIEWENDTLALDRAHTCVERAAGQPLDLVIRYKAAVDKGVLESWIQSKVNKIRSLMLIHLARENGGNLLAAVPTFPLRFLKRFQILGLEDIELNLAIIASIITKSPQLTSLQLSGVACLHSPVAFIGVGGQITHLSIGEHSHIDYMYPLRVDAVLEVLAFCESLRSLECHSLGEEEGEQEPEIIHLSYLTSLTIGDGPETCRILFYLDTPRLHTLRLSRGKVLDGREMEMDMPTMEVDDDGYPALFINCLEILYCTCKPAITRVIWDHTVVDVSILADCAAYIPHLSTLTVIGITGLSLDFLSLSTPLPLYSFLRGVEIDRCSIQRSWWQEMSRLYGPTNMVRRCPLPNIRVFRCDGASDINLGV